MNHVARKILQAFSKIQRPLAWGMLAGGVITFVAVASNIVSTGSAKWASLLAALILMFDGVRAAADVENELDSEGAVDDKNVPD